MMDYVLFGIQGSGKGTQGTVLAGKINAAYFETGAHLRELSQENSELGKKVKTIIEAGNLVSTEVVIEIVEDFINKAEGERPIVFDGIPRSEEQRIAFEELLLKLDRKYTGLFFQLDREEAIKRLTTRRICSIDKKAYQASFRGNMCPEHDAPLVTRSDDTPDSINTRLDLFEEETMPIIEQWKTKGKIIEIDAAQAIEEVTQSMHAALS